MKKIITGSLFLILLVMLAYTLMDGSREKGKGGESGNNGNQEGTAMESPNAPEPLKVGSEAPDFELKNKEGERVKLSDFQGKKIFLNFWASWCAPCREEMPELEKFEQDYGEEVVVLTVNATGDELQEGDARDYLATEGFSFRVLFDPQLEATNMYNIIAYPTTYFIGTDGTIQLENHRGPMTYAFMKEKMNQLE
ncbi:TlpA disulfide reductase family protein [Thalassobacillus sp. CUG 92003]|uniref:TlpA family protein disulfide reductase n=1 Tax=Thalassobacillus sp. CUG 92003 TaxID=2736641 RepID=UPI0015E6AEAA|nr:TlpA disulfide reductase family protein [Thalassobacillus sp. CUG 92003]